jgi:branched-chain amino acid transport system permease protein
MSGIIIQSIVISGFYALIAIGFTMIFSVGRVLNLAYGVYIMLGGYVYYALVQMAHLPKTLGFLCAILSGVIFAVITYAGLVKRLQSNPIAVEISTLILAVAMQAVMILIFTPAPRSIWPLIPGVVHLFGVSILKNLLLAMIISWVVLGSLLIFVRKTLVGRAIRAVSMDRKGALVSGIDPNRINLVIWGLSGALGAIAGVFFANLYAT